MGSSNCARMCVYVLKREFSSVSSTNKLCTLEPSVNYFDKNLCVFVPVYIDDVMQLVGGYFKKH